MHLGSCPVDEDVEVVEVDVPSGTRLRLHEVGIRVGTTVRVSQRAPFGGRVVAVGASRLAVDRATAGRIAVRPLP
ncbi:FeoA family protein [Actinotalea subterranea]|uniref:FeoA family protein n=1 Tax=Actinotalea subterranea TaxID=2607497 RepID=UPI0011ED90D6|nr:FeoA family protein [Actinotalea subterranea]